MPHEEKKKNQGFASWVLNVSFIEILQTCYKQSLHSTWMSFTTYLNSYSQIWRPAIVLRYTFCYDPLRSNRTFKCSPCKVTLVLSNSGISAEDNTCPKINTMKIVFFDPRAYMITYIMVIIWGRVAGIPDFLPIFENRYQDFQDCLSGFWLLEKVREPCSVDWGNVNAFFLNWCCWLP